MCCAYCIPQLGTCPLDLYQFRKHFLLLKQHKSSIGTAEVILSRGHLNDFIPSYNCKTIVVGGVRQNFDLLYIFQPITQQLWNLNYPAIFAAIDWKEWRGSEFHHVVRSYDGATEETRWSWLSLECTLVTYSFSVGH